MLTATVLSLLLLGAPAGTPDSTSAADPAPALAPALVKALTPSAPRRVGRASLANPRSTVQGYLLAARAARYAEAARFLDLSQIPEDERAKRGPLLAREMKVVLDQKLWVDLESLSDFSEGKPDDGLPPNRDRVGVIETSRGAFEINLVRDKGPDGDLEWRFSPGTLDRVETLYSEIGYGVLLAWIPTGRRE